MGSDPGMSGTRYSAFDLSIMHSKGVGGVMRNVAPPDIPVGAARQLVGSMKAQNVNKVLILSTI